MSDNHIVVKIDHPLFLKRESWLKKKLQEALDQPFIPFNEAISTYRMGIYFIYDANELLYIGVTERPGHNRLKEIIRGFRKHTFNRKLVAEHFRQKGHVMHVFSIKNYKRDWIETGIITIEELRDVQKGVNKHIKNTLRFKFFEFDYTSLFFLEHYAIATLQPLYND